MRNVNQNPQISNFKSDFFPLKDVSSQNSKQRQIYLPWIKSLQIFNRNSWFWEGISE